MKVYLTSDHGGFELKAKLKPWLEQKGYEVEDLGPTELIPDDDYPDYAVKLTNALVATPKAKGIGICRSSEGMCMAVNRVRGMRGASAWDVAVAKKSREHNDANILCLSSDDVDEKMNFQIAEAWLKEPFSGDERHVRRLQKIDAIAPEQIQFPE